MTHMEFAHPYFGAFVMFLVTFGAFMATVWLSRYVSRKIARLDTEKLNPRAGDAIGRGGDRVSCRTAGCSYHLERM